MPEIMKLLGSNKSKITKDGYGENVLHLQINEVVLTQFILSTTIPNKNQEPCINSFLINNSNFPYIEVWFTNQNSVPLEIEDKVNITLVNN